MTRKDYQLIAMALREERPQPSWANKWIQWNADAQAIANALYKESAHNDINGNLIHSFNAAKFGAACGLIVRPDGSMWPIGSNPTIAQILG